jgi:hypothetical protein
MGKVAAVVMVLCGALATPVLGVWIYDGTEVWISEPDSDADPNGTWWWGWDGDGSVNGNAYYLEAEGWTTGYSGVWLAPYWGTGLYSSAYAASDVYGRSTY